ncbi:hypothetical protein [Saccharopolyspora sp. 7B]|uniref:hypothetical protein n=1 Tax=Saccharopolyspora sp. 7B TaxID=2877240 RepID=UPI001CD7BD05|nr:hypothetical protein [Saccharopolyspora sp. 7B]MCA1280460.1 hypothetical protein [Saccharopolyspora sp. 7B]
MTQMDDSNHESLHGSFRACNMGVMSIPGAHTVSKRENLPLLPDEVDLVERLMTPESPERIALENLVPEVGTSKAAVLRAAFHAGIDNVRAQALDESYRRMAAEMTDTEHAERRAHTSARRERLAARNDE